MRCSERDQEIRHKEHNKPDHDAPCNIDERPTLPLWPECHRGSQKDHGRIKHRLGQQALEMDPKAG